MRRQQTRRLISDAQLEALRSAATTQQGERHNVDITLGLLITTLNPIRISYI